MQKIRISPSQSISNKASSARSAPKQTIKLPPLLQTNKENSTMTHTLLSTDKFNHEKTAASNRPWAAKSIDLNQVTIKSATLKDCLKDNRPKIEEKRREAQRIFDSPIQEIELLKTQRPRERNYSCRTAMKKGFPMKLKHCERAQPIEQRFEGENLSTISRAERQDSFMSESGYNQLAL